MHRSGTSLITKILSGTGIKLPSDLLPSHPEDNSGGYLESREVVRINNAFLAAVDSSWKRPEPISDVCFSCAAASRARSDICAFLGRCKADSHDLLLKDPRMCRLMPLWAPELKSHYEHLVIVQAIRRADAVFRSLASRAESESPGVRLAAVTSKAQSDLLWLHYNLEIDRYAHRERRFVIAYEDVLDDPDAVVRRLVVEVGRLLLRELVMPSHRPHAAPSVEERLLSDRERVLESVYRALRGSTENAASYLDAAWEHLQVRIPAPHQEQPVSADPDLFYRARMRHFTSKCGYRPVFPEPPTIIRTIASRLKTFVQPDRKVQSLDPPILFISGNPATRGHLYRVKNAVEGLLRLGVPACWMSIEALKQDSVGRVNARCVIIHRCIHDPLVERLQNWCKRRGIPVGFDIDDLIFDVELMRARGIHFIANLPSSRQHQWQRDASAYRRVMESVDFCIVPTRTLADHARRVNPKVYVIENGFSVEMLALSDFWRLGRSPDPAMVRIGYASGTNTHAADFATVAHSLAETLRRHPEWHFVLVGSLDLRPYSDLLPPAQVEKRPLVEHVNLACELARFDVNLAPLQPDNAFCDAKSPLKYFEAALVGVPTIAARNPVYAELIRGGENGFLARSEEEWAGAIETLAGEGATRDRLSAAAREECIARFHENRLAEKYLRLPI